MNLGDVRVEYVFILSLVWMDGNLHILLCLFSVGDLYADNHSRRSDVKVFVVILVDHWFQIELSAFEWTAVYVPNE